MMMKKYNLYIILFICTLSSCSDFLEESSQDLMIPRSVKDYKELFFGEVMKTNEKDIPHPYLEYMTDDVKDQCYYGTRPQVISNDFREYVWAYYTWQGNPEVGISNELTPDVAWTVYYHKILMTNIILDQLYTMNGTDMERQVKLISCGLSRILCLLICMESLIILQRQMKTYVYRSIKKSAYQIR